MPTFDDLSHLNEKPFSDALDKLRNLLTTESGRAFLLGAGCSKCAGLPLTVDLTRKVFESVALDQNTKDILAAIQENFAGSSGTEPEPILNSETPESSAGIGPVPNIEDYLSELVDHLAIADRRMLLSEHSKQIALSAKPYSADLLREGSYQIKRAIAKEIDIPVAIQTHLDFVRAVQRPIRPGKARSNLPVEYLVLNYDTLVEDALALEKVLFADGIEGGVTGWWNPKTFERADLSARVLKLHGSINWSEQEADKLPRRVPPKLTDAVREHAHVVIWPASTKYRETQRDPYAQLAHRARKVLNPPEGGQCILGICGYSFGDSHINYEVDCALKESERRLTIVAFTSSEKPEGILKEWHEDSSIRDQVLIYGKRGFWHGDTVIPSTADLNWWQFENITRILGGER